MRTAVILLVALVCSASAMTAFKRRAAATKMDYAAIEATKAKVTYTFGDLLNLFQTSDFQVNDQLVQFLNGLTSQIQDEHNAALAQYTQDRADCSDEFEFRQNEIANAQTSLAASQAQLQLASAEEQRAENLGDLASQALVIWNQQLDDLRNARAAQIALYDQRSASLANAVDQINTALNILDEFELAAQGVIPPSFIEVVNTLLAITVKTGHSHKILPIYNKLIQAQSSQFDVSDLQDLRDLLNNLLSNVQEGQVTIDDQEASDAATFSSDQADLLAVIARLQDQVNASAEYAARMAASVQQEESISLQAQGKITRNSDLLAQAQQLCQDADNEFAQGEATRRQQLEFLSQISSAVQALEVQFGQSLLPNIGDLVSLENSSSESS